MAQKTFGSITIIYPDDILLEDKAGTMSTEEQQKVVKAFKGVGRAAEATAEAMRNHPDRLQVNGVTADGLEAAGRAADRMDGVISDLELAVMTFKQSNLIKDGEAHKQLLKVNTFVNGQKKYDPTLPQLVTDLGEYFHKG